MLISALFALLLFMVNLWLNNNGKKEIMEKLETMDKKLDRLDDIVEENRAQTKKLDKILDILEEIRDILKSRG